MGVHQGAGSQTWQLLNWVHSRAIDRYKKPKKKKWTTELHCYCDHSPNQSTRNHEGEVVPQETQPWESKKGGMWRQSEIGECEESRSLWSCRKARQDLARDCSSLLSRSRIAWGNHLYIFLAVSELRDHAPFILPRIRPILLSYLCPECSNIVQYLPKEADVRLV